jgi:hypothetical protein
MKKVIILFCVISINSFAQKLEKGAKLVGADISAGFTKVDKKGNNTMAHIGVIPSYETFLGSRFSFLLGAGVSTQKVSGKSGFNNDYTISTQSFNADLGLNIYYFQNEKVNLYFGPRLQYIGTRIKEDAELGLKGKLGANVQYLSVITGGLFNIKNNLFLSARINALSLVLDSNENGLQVNTNSFEIGSTGKINIGFKKLIKSK